MQLALMQGRECDPKSPCLGRRQLAACHLVQNVAMTAIECDAAESRQRPHAIVRQCRWDHVQPVTVIDKLYEQVPVLEGVVRVGILQLHDRAGCE